MCTSVRRQAPQTRSNKIGTASAVIPWQISQAVETKHLKALRKPTSFAKLMSANAGTSPSSPDLERTVREGLALVTSSGGAGLTR